MQRVVVLPPAQLLTVCDEGSRPAHPGSEDEEKDSTALLNEILGSISVAESDFTPEWMDVFGRASGVPEAAAAEAGAGEDEQREPAFFLPSQLLDHSPSQRQSSLSGQNLNQSVNLHAQQNPIRFLLVVRADHQVSHVNQRNPIYAPTFPLITPHVFVHVQGVVLFLFAFGFFLQQWCVQKKTGSEILAPTLGQLTRRTDVLPNLRRTEGN